MQLLRDARDRGARFARVDELDECVCKGRPAWFLKHDVHALHLPAMLDVAREQRDAGILGTYLFMAPDHPLTQPAYTPAEQFDAMRQVQALGHQVGVHVDPYFLLHQRGGMLEAILRDLLDTCVREGVPARVGNMHGHSRFKHPDADGFGTMFDLFEEIARQPDFPALGRVPPATRDILRAQRTSLRALGFTHWCDMPMWSAVHGVVTTNFITDNRLAKNGMLEVLTQPQTIGAYALADRQPPGSRTPAAVRQRVPCADATWDGTPPTNAHVPFEQDACQAWFHRLARQPTLFLVHPEHYCTPAPDAPTSPA